MSVRAHAPFGQLSLLCGPLLPIIAIVLLRPLHCNFQTLKHLSANGASTEEGKTTTHD